MSCAIKREGESMNNAQELESTRLVPTSKKDCTNNCMAPETLANGGTSVIARFRH